MSKSEIESHASAEFIVIFHSWLPLWKLFSLVRSGHAIGQEAVKNPFNLGEQSKVITLYHACHHESGGRRR